MDIVIDQRMELLTSLEFLSNCVDPGFMALTKFETSYKKDFIKYFSPYKDHQAVELYTKMSISGFSLDGSAAAMFHLSNPPYLKIERPFEEWMIQRANGKDQLENFIHLLREFAIETRFVEFFEKHEEAFQKMIIDSKKELIASKIIKPIESYYGAKQHSYTVLLLPLFRQGGNGFRIRRDEDTYDAYAIIGPAGVKDTLPYFDSTKTFTLWHEFSHHFVDPMTEKFEDELRPKFQSLSDKRQDYPAWENIVNEYIIRGITARLAFHYEGNEFALRVLKSERGEGFIHIDSVYNKLKEYESDRETYDKLIKFYPRIIEVLEKSLM
jgi:tetratricopeptide (TPR) repeat protein